MCTGRKREKGRLRVMPRLNGNIGEGAAHQSYPPAQYNGFHTAYSIEPERENLVYSEPKKKKKRRYRVRLRVKVKAAPRSPISTQCATTTTETPARTRLLLHCAVQFLPWVRRRARRMQDLPKAYFPHTALCALDARRHHPTFEDTELCLTTPSTRSAECIALIRSTAWLRGESFFRESLDYNLRHAVTLLGPLVGEKLKDTASSHSQLRRHAYLICDAPDIQPRVRVAEDIIPLHEEGPRVAAEHGWTKCALREPDRYPAFLEVEAMEVHDDKCLSALSAYPLTDLLLTVDVPASTSGASSSTIRISWGNETQDDSRRQLDVKTPMDLDDPTLGVQSAVDGRTLLELLREFYGNLDALFRSREQDWRSRNHGLAAATWTAHTVDGFQDVQIIFAALETMTSAAFHSELDRSVDRINRLVFDEIQGLLTQLICRPHFKRPCQFSSKRIQKMYASATMPVAVMPLFWELLEQSPPRQIRMPFSQPNLAFHRASIIFVNTKAIVGSYYMHWTNNGVSVARSYSDLSDREMQEGGWMAGEYTWIVATGTLLQGIDNSRCRVIILVHFNPGLILSAQGYGCAGRGRHQVFAICVGGSRLPQPGAQIPDLDVKLFRTFSALLATVWRIRVNN
ncbi:hypothetical protein B0H13DRAFT_1934358 [Mycena leptocephala]|nr:hypothetical protein B0H13DRAFT_1934358 [Mycena leptocephala]